MRELDKELKELRLYGMQRELSSVTWPPCLTSSSQAPAIPYRRSS